jgi:hypothetical protein
LLQTTKSGPKRERRVASSCRDDYYSSGHGVDRKKDTAQATFLLRVYYNIVLSDCNAASSVVRASSLSQTRATHLRLKAE